MKIIVIFACCLFYTALMVPPNSYAAENGCIRDEVGNEINIEVVSLIEIISRPETFDGKCIQTMGFASVTDFEDVALYIDREAYDYRMTANAVWLEGAGENASNRGYDHRYVRVEGVFRVDRRGYGRLYSGGIDQVRIIYAYNGPDQYKLIRHNEFIDLMKTSATKLLILLSVLSVVVLIIRQLIRNRNHLRN
jgi:hypothetical protein